MATVTEILTDIRDKHGILTPEIVREEARPEDSPIHAYIFNKPADEAAEAYYLDRAHRLIQMARVTIRENESTQPISVRAFFSIPGEEARYVYEPVAEIVSDPMKFESARKEASRRLREAESALDMLDSLAIEPKNARASAKAKKAVQTARRELEKAA